MAKNRHRYTRQRDVLNRIANDRRASFLDDLDQSLLSNFDTAVRSPLQEVEDRREYHPMGDDAPVRSSRRWSVSSVSPTATSGRSSPAGVRPYLFSPPVQIGFRAPLGVAVCQRRGTRREVLFALGKARKGSGARFRRRNQFSNTRC